MFPSLSALQLMFDNRSRESQSFVTIIVGKDDAQQEFRVHKNVITYYSTFFSAAFNSDFKEGLTQTMILEDIEVPIFGFFNNWLYTQKFETVDGESLQTIEYAKLWTLSQRFLMHDLTTTLLKKIENSIPKTAAKSAGILRDLQHYVYNVADQQEDSALKEITIKKSLYIAEKVKEFPEGMLIGVILNLLGGCTKLSGWQLGLGMEGVESRMEKLLWSEKIALSYESDDD
jgi:hypothetical protein